VRDVWNPVTILVLLKSLKFDQRRIPDLRRHLICSCMILMIFASTSVQIRAQDDHAGHAPSEPVPREILDRPVPLRTGIGTVHEKVSTSSPEAQSFYDQGLA
jgi:hypothetical protein